MNSYAAGRMLAMGGLVLGLAGGAYALMNGDMYWGLAILWLGGASALTAVLVPERKQPEAIEGPKEPTEMIGS